MQIYKPPSDSWKEGGTKLKGGGKECHSSCQDRHGKLVIIH